MHPSRRDGCDWCRVVYMLWSLTAQNMLHNCKMGPYAYAGQFPRSLPAEMGALFRLWVGARRLYYTVSSSHTQRLRQRLFQSTKIVPDFGKSISKLTLCVHMYVNV